jgi:hypothetical protein
MKNRRNHTKRSDQVTTGLALAATLFALTAAAMALLGTATGYGAMSAFLLASLALLVASCFHTRTRRLNRR